MSSLYPVQEVSEEGLHRTDGEFLLCMYADDLQMHVVLLFGP